MDQIIVTGKSYILYHLTLRYLRVGEEYFPAPLMLGLAMRFASASGRLVDMRLAKV